MFLGLFCFQFLPSRKITSISPFFGLGFIFKFLTAAMGTLWYKPPGSAGFIDIFNPFIWIEFSSSCQTLLKFCKNLLKFLAPSLTYAGTVSKSWIFISHWDLPLSSLPSLLKSHCFWSWSCHADFAAMLVGLGVGRCRSCCWDVLTIPNNAQSPGEARLPSPSHPSSAGWVCTRG